MPALLAGLKIYAISLFGPLIQVQGCIAAVPGWRRKSRFRLQHFVRQVGFSAMSTNSEWTRASWRHGGQLLLPLQRARRWFNLIWLGADCTLHIYYDSVSSYQASGRGHSSYQLVKTSTRQPSRHKGNHRQPLQDSYH